MSMEISYRLHVSSADPDRSVTLPALPGSKPFQAPMLDLFGQQFQRTWPLAAAASVGGGVIGSKLLRLGGGGIFRGIVGGIGGALAGASLLTAGLMLAKGSSAHRAPDPVAGASVAAISVAERERVKVMTFNVHGGMGGPGEYLSSTRELDEIAEAVRREQPDVVLLQEVDGFAGRSSLTDTLNELDKRLDPTSSVGASATTSVFGRDQHTAIMTFNDFKITDARNIVHQDPRGGGARLRASATLDLAYDVIDKHLGSSHSRDGAQRQVRNTVEAMVRTPAGAHVRVLSGHYEAPNERFDHQQLQVGELAGALDAWRGPTIWGGDFNVRDGDDRGAQERGIMLSAGLHDTLEGVPRNERVSMVGYPIGAGNEQADRGGIDRIYASSHARLIDAYVAREAGASSDHLPVVAELELTPSLAS